MKKRIIAIIISAVLLSATYVAGSEATVFGCSEAERRLADALADSVRNYSTEHELNADGISSAELHHAVRLLCDGYPELFYLSPSFDISVTEQDDGHRTAVVTFSYTMPVSAIPSAIADAESWRSEVLSLAGAGLSELEYALFFHDYLAVNYEYDGTDTVCDLYSLIKSGCGSSYAYASAYAYLLSSVGIFACRISSAEMERSWNLVQIDGDTYHVDVARDDTGDLGGVRHEYFLMSDVAVTKPSASEPLGHYGWESPLECTSELYDDISLKMLNGSTARLGDRLYYAVDGKLCAMTSATDTGCTVLELPWDPTPSDTPVYGSVIAYGEYLYICTPSSVLETDPASGTVTVRYRCDDTDFICGFGIYTGTDGISGAGLRDGNARILVSSLSSEVRSVTIDLKKTVTVRGDADGNGVLGLSDVTAVLKYLADDRAELDTSAADVNGDGIISLTDVTMMLKILAGWNV